MDWFLYAGDLRNERVKGLMKNMQRFFKVEKGASQRCWSGAIVTEFE